MNYKYSEIINGKEYRLVTINNRSKLISFDGDAINPYKRNQKATIHYNKDGYPCFGGGIPVHKYVAYGWVDGYFENAEINHIDFNRTNYCADNLEWISHIENVKKSVTNNSDVWNSSRQGVHNGHCKHTEEDIRKIRKLYDSGKKVSEILTIILPNLKHNTKEYKSIYTTYWNICLRKTWKTLN